MKKILSLLLAFSLALSLAACGGSASSAVSSTAVSEAASSAAASEEETAAPLSATEPLRIAGLKGPTTMGLVNLLSMEQAGTAAMDYDLQLYGAADEIVPLLIKGELDMAAIPANLAATLYQKTNGGIQAVAVNTLGVLYVVEQGDTVHSMADLKGRTILSTGKGTTPEYVLRYLLTSNGLDPDKDVDIQYYSEATEVTAQMASTQDAIAVLPQPYVTAAGLKDDTLRIALDLTAEWDKVADTQLITGVTVVRKAYAEEHPDVVAAFLADYAQSVNAANTDLDGTAALCEEQGVVAKAAIAKKALAHAKDYGNDIIILDTAGRLQIDEVLMQELVDIKAAVPVDETLLVVDAMAGQDAVNVAKTFNETVGVDGIILTKTDGDTRGGAALSVLAVTGKPIKFQGTGEKLDDLDVFHPDRMASRILGMGDVLSLIERAQDAADEKAAEETAKRLMENKFDMNDMLEQFAQIRKMGGAGAMLSMLPGASGIDASQIDEKAFDRIEAMIYSMTKEEREKPSIINPKRKRRIAAGSGTRVEDVNKLLKQYEMMQKMMKQFKKSPKGFARRLGGMMGNPNAFRGLK